ncbi:MAG: murC [Candidatus Paceibacter sp.]|jgi:UDP-N-acetylmuramate--alanine ligase|nr:murC [Candidatus Paceibacter sp.]
MIIDFAKFKKVHFIGIGGIGISAIARMMMLEGKKVSGSDRDESNITHELRKLGAEIFIGQDAHNIDAKTDLVIYTVAIPDDNPELMKAKELGVTTISYPQALGAISEQKYTIAVSGAHGKTTTTAMIAKVLIDAELDPTVVVGSLLKDYESNFVAGKGKYLVAEACEYKRSFLNLAPKILVITNIDDDHLDYYKDIEDIKSAFIEMVEKIPEDGFLVCDLEQPHVVDVARKAKCTVIDYELFADMNLELKIPGDHNLANAAAALAVADILEINRKKAEESLQNFSGTWRRFEFKGKTKTGALVYDDYGHHPTEVKATLRGVRQMFPDRRVTVIFQPHLFSRTKQHLHEFAKAFVDADNVILAPIYPAREPFDETISSDMVALEIVKNGGIANAFPSLDAVELHAKKELGSDKDVLITMGAGDIYKIGEKLVANE